MFLGSKTRLYYTKPNVTKLFTHHKSANLKFKSTSNLTKYFNVPHLLWRHRCRDRREEEEALPETLPMMYFNQRVLCKFFKRSKVITVLGINSTGCKYKWKTSEAWLLAQPYGSVYRKVKLREGHCYSCVANVSLASQSQIIINNRFVVHTENICTIRIDGCNSHSYYYKPKWVVMKMICFEWSEWQLIN